jgi:tetratricopeptide (TPR) repeat protein
VAAADAITGQFLDVLKEAGIYDRAVIVLVSDHGEGLWQHGEDQHGILLYREVLHVPMMIKLPKNTRAGETVKEPAALIDLMPTLAKLVGVEPPELPKAADLLAPLPAGRRIYSETYYPRIHLGWSELRSIVDAQHQYIDAPRAELYDVVRDPEEKHDLAATERRIAADLRKEVSTYPSGLQALQPVDPEDAKKLEALGYLGSVQSTGSAEPLPNPKDMLPYLEQIKAAFKLADERRYGAAVELMRALLAKNPGLFDVRDKLGEIYLDMGDYKEAIAVYREAMTRAQHFSPEMALSLGEAYLKNGEPDEAARYADLASKGLPAGAHALAARVALSRGDYRTAEEEARQAIGAQNPQPASMLLLAEVKRAEGDFPAALRELDAAAQRAKELNVPALYRLEYLRGDTLARMDRPAEAKAAYEREIATFPQDLQAYANLAIIAFIEGRRGEVDRLLEQMAAANPHRGAYTLAAVTLETLEQHDAAARWRARAERAR